MSHDLNCQHLGAYVYDNLYCPDCNAIICAPGPDIISGSEIQLINGDKFTGELVRGIPQGYGILRLKEGLGRHEDETETFLEGNFIDGLLNGNGKITTLHSDGSSYHEYVGNLKDNKPNGQGHFQFSYGRYYEGGFKDGNYHGKGTLSFPPAWHYTGEFREGKCHGQGKQIYPPISGCKHFYEGDFKNDKRHGNGTLHFPSGAYYQGEWQDDYMSGNGLYKSSEGSVLEGRFIIERGYAKGGTANYWTIICSNGKKFFGQFQDDGTFEDHTSTLQKLRNKF